jgi:RimJ/RimL family protein N-acetyltransferase
VQVSIRFYEESDAKPLQEAARESSPDVFPWLPWCHPNHSLQDGSAWISAQIQARAAGTAYEFVITSDDGRFLGGCGLNHIENTDRRANLGYWVRSSATGRGVGSQAAQALSVWAFSETDLERLEIVVARDNLASQRVAERAGAVREGIARRRLFLHGRFHDAVMYSIIRQGPAARKGALAGVE